MDEMRKIDKKEFEKLMLDIIEKERFERVKRKQEIKREKRDKELKNTFKKYKNSRVRDSDLTREAKDVISELQEKRIVDKKELKVEIIKKDYRNLKFEILYFLQDKEFTKISDIVNGIKSNYHQVYYFLTLLHVDDMVIVKKRVNVKDMKFFRINENGLNYLKFHSDKILFSETMIKIIDKLKERDYTRKELVDLLNIPRTTLYDNLYILKKRKLVRNYTKNRNIRSRPLTFWSLDKEKLKELMELI